MVSILDAAIEIMSTEGYEGLSASRLAAAASISKANLFHHFRTLEDVPIAAFEVIANQIVAAQLPANGTAHDFIAAMGELALATLAERRGFYAAYVSFLARAVFELRLKHSVQTSLRRSKADVPIVRTPGHLNAFSFGQAHRQTGGLPVLRC